MISREKLLATSRIVTHADCADGLSSAMILRDAFAPTGKVPPIVFCRHGDEALSLPVVPGTLFCDFSPPKERYQEHLLAGGIVLDHHRTSREIVEAYGDDGVYANERTRPGVSGAVLAYENVWKPLAGDGTGDDVLVQRFAHLIGVRDTWQRRSADWREACARTEVLSFFPQERWLERDLGQVLQTWEDVYTDLGETLLLRNERYVERTIEGGHRFVSARGTRVIAFNATRPVSDAAEKLGSEVDLIVGYAFQAHEGIPQVRFALRSHTRYDCAELAGRFGGGGHTAAAGFRIRIYPSHPEPFGLIENLLREHEEQKQ